MQWNQSQGGKAGGGRGGRHNHFKWKKEFDQKKTTPIDGKAIIKSSKCM